MKEVLCSGTPFEIGIHHGRVAKSEIDRALKFYRDLFMKTAHLSWSEVCAIAAKFAQILNGEWLAFHEEIQGK